MANTTARDRLAGIAGEAVRARPAADAAMERAVAATPEGVVTVTVVRALDAEVGDRFAIQGGERAIGVDEAADAGVGGDVTLRAAGISHTVVVDLAPDFVDEVEARVTAREREERDEGRACGAHGVARARRGRSARPSARSQQGI